MADGEGSVSEPLEERLRPTRQVQQDSGVRGQGGADTHEEVQREGEVTREGQSPDPSPVRMAACRFAILTASP